MFWWWEALWLWWLSKKFYLQTVTTNQSRKRMFHFNSEICVPPPPPLKVFFPASPFILIIRLNTFVFAWSQPWKSVYTFFVFSTDQELLWSLQSNVSIVLDDYADQLMQYTNTISLINLIYCSKKIIYWGLQFCFQIQCSATDEREFLTGSQAITWQIIQKG